MTYRETGQHFLLRNLRESEPSRRYRRLRSSRGGPSHLSLKQITTYRLRSIARTHRPTDQETNRCLYFRSARSLCHSRSARRRPISPRAAGDRDQPKKCPSHLIDERRQFAFRRATSVGRCPDRCWAEGSADDCRVVRRPRRNCDHHGWRQRPTANHRATIRAR